MLLVMEALHCSVLGVMEALQCHGIDGSTYLLCMRMEAQKPLEIICKTHTVLLAMGEESTIVIVVRTIGLGVGQGEALQ